MLHIFVFVELVPHCETSARDYARRVCCSLCAVKCNQLCAVAMCVVYVVVAAARLVNTHLYQMIHFVAPRATTQ